MAIKQKKPELPDGFEFVENNLYVSKVGDIFWYNWGGDYETVTGYKDKTFRDLKEYYAIQFLARKTGKLTPYFKDLTTKPYPHGF